MNFDPVGDNDSPAAQRFAVALLSLTDVEPT
ncbi:MAG: hypothetical protein RL685_387 [Pseudomonadota bacterium]